MALSDSEKALRAKVELATRHAHDQRREALEQRVRARNQRAAELARVGAAQASTRLAGPTVRCVRCGGIWSSGGILSTMRRRPACPLCGAVLRQYD